MGKDLGCVAMGRVSEVAAVGYAHTSHVSDGSGLSLRVRVQVQTELLLNRRSGSSLNPNR